MLDVISSESILTNCKVELLQVTGDDEFPGHIARVCTNSQKRSGAINLVKRLIEDKHNTPIEFIQTIWRIRAPIFVARHLMRYRCATINEQSGRFSEFDGEYYVPNSQFIRFQGTSSNKLRPTYPSNQQDFETAEDCCQAIHDQSREAYAAYRKLLDKGIAREVARIILPVNFLTQWMWRLDARSLRHIIEERTKLDTQFETRQIVESMQKQISKHLPVIFS